MEAALEQDQGCEVFGRLSGLDAESIHRFVVGEDERPRVLTAEEAQAELGDPFATLLLLAGEFPRTGAEVMDGLRAKSGNSDPLAQRRTFVLGEGSQLADGPGIEEVDRRMRFVATTGESGSDGPDVVVSTFHPDSPDVEVMAWDRQSDGFNYYRTVGDGAWAFAGNSRHALSEPTEGKGPFESHRSGAMLMKELQIPWVNWHSFEAPMPETVFPDGDDRRTHPWFTGKEGAEVFELAAAVPSIRRWARARFDRIAANGGEVSDARRMMRQVLDAPMVNLITSRAESSDPDEKGGVLIPPSFFFSSFVLTREPIGLSPAPDFRVATDVYRTSVETLGLALRDGRGFEQKGDVKFAFLVPERALEDDAVLEAAMTAGLITPRLAAALLMVDFPNPIFSDRRRSLLDHVPAEARIADGASGFSEQTAEAILAAADSAPDGSPEREFAARWEVGEDFAGAFDELLGAYFAAVSERLATQQGFDDYMRLAESRRLRTAEEMAPIIESPLLFPQTAIPRAERAMAPDGSVTTSEG